VTGSFPRPTPVTPSVGSRSRSPLWGVSVAAQTNGRLWVIADTAYLSLSRISLDLPMPLQTPLFPSSRCPDVRISEG
jgi:hypothetical protein